MEMLDSVSKEAQKQRHDLSSEPAVITLGA
ncbi:uncharacterized protein FRV6_16517 [Fusarium oxysporum]|uniref:Uncharacterized protein n=1 Tax=Fusarium oxysporum TaxID=5507 RepID=A0A2H3UEY1_FUSOX|nr:uncharacterized protein FRV6_16517 [Fusarium oxysporum]